MESLSANWFEKNYRRRLLTADFYQAPTAEVAKSLLGKILWVRSRSSRHLVAGRIIETEAYVANDPAAHCFRGWTKRCAPMFESPGYSYVYYIYGMYNMLNFVTEAHGTPGAVLIRALEPLVGIDLMQKRRGQTQTHLLTNGPGKLTNALGITLKDNRSPLFGPKFFVLDEKPKKGEVLLRSPRVGIGQGRGQGKGKSKSKDPLLRFFFANNPYISRAPENKRAYEI